ncbi:MAG: DUF58 domain-containing protein [Acidobacteria bacterium]|nr:MAG: DUF58 domain-containing protein [Acidobacteriota bacterium]
MHSSVFAQQTRSKTRFLDPSVLARIRNLELIARTVVDGFISGLHRSPNLGFSLDFAEYRQYMPGDDVRRIDWKVFARSDRFYVKEYEGETNTYVHLLLDISASMGYGSRPKPDGITKIEYASYLAASLAYFAQRQKDSVGLVTFDYRIVDRLPPRCRIAHMNSILHLLDRAKTSDRSEFHKPLEALAKTIRRRGIVVLISDLYAPTDEVVKSLSLFRFKGNDVVIMHVLDPQELDFNFAGGVRLLDMETKREAVLSADQAKTDYLRLMNEHTSRIKKECGVLGIDYELLSTSRPLDYALYSYLYTRQKSM